jgi:hypothetical protein
MMNDRFDGPGRVTFHLPAEAFALALFLKYLGLFLYGVTATVALVPSFLAVGGSAFALSWAMIVAVLGGLAASGVIRTWRSNDDRLEQVTTALLVLGFLAYSVVILVRGMLLDNWDAIAAAWLPAIIAILPTIRYYTLVWKKG